MHLQKIDTEKNIYLTSPSLLPLRLPEKKKKNKLVAGSAAGRRWLNPSILPAEFSYVSFLNQHFFPSFPPLPFPHPLSFPPPPLIPPPIPPSLSVIPSSFLPIITLHSPDVPFLRTLHSSHYRRPAPLPSSWVSRRRFPTRGNNPLRGRQQSEPLSPPFVVRGVLGLKFPTKICGFLELPRVLSVREGLRTPPYVV